MPTSAAELRRMVLGPEGRKVQVAKAVHVWRCMVPCGTDAAEGHEWISECLYALPPMTVYCWEAGDLCPEFFTNRIPNPRRALSPDLHPLQRRRWAEEVGGGGGDEGEEGGGGR